MDNARYKKLSESLGRVVDDGLGISGGTKLDSVQETITRNSNAVSLERIAAALERIADKLEDRNAPAMAPLSLRPVGALKCPECGGTSKSFDGICVGCYPSDPLEARNG